MKKSFLAGVAVIGLTAASVAYAQEDATTDMGEAATQIENTMEGAANATGNAIEDTGDAVTDEMDMDATAQEGMVQSYGSYRGTEPGSFTGTIAGDYSADDLMERDIVGSDGEEIGEISDLLIGSDGSIQNVLVDVGGFLGIGTRTVALDLNQVQMGTGDDGDLMVSMTKEQIEALPEVEENDGNWSTVNRDAPLTPADPALDPAVPVAPTAD